MLQNLPEQLGRALQGQRAGMENIALYRLLLERDVAHIDLHSSAFENLGAIPQRYTADGDGISPPLHWRGVPEGAAVGVLLVEDADSPTPRPLVHAVAVALDPRDGAIREGALLSADDGARDALELGLNSLLKKGWLPPDPPPGHGEHRYAFQIFALRAGTPFSHSPGRQEVFDAILERAIAAGGLIGIYERARRVPVREGELAQDDMAEADGAVAAPGVIADTASA